MAESTVTLKLLIDTEAKRVLFGEASKDFVDFLFYMISLPVSKIINLLGKECTAGPLTNLYESIENLNDSYIQPNQSKDTLLKPDFPLNGFSVPLLAIKDAPAEKKFYRCGRCPSSSPLCISDNPSATCPYCYLKMIRAVKYVSPTPVEEQDEGGFVKGVVTYTVTDDLVVKPMSSISSVTLLNQLNVKNVAALSEKVVDIGMSEAVQLLKASLETKDVLTHVFLKDLDDSTGCPQRDEEDVVGTKRRRQSGGTRPSKAVKKE